MVVCKECKTPFLGFDELKSHFKTHHRAEFVAICLWLGPELGDRASLEDWWLYELRFKRRKKSEKREKQPKIVVPNAFHVAA